jgi:hypothetical protein
VPGKIQRDGLYLQASARNTLEISKRLLSSKLHLTYFVLIELLILGARAAGKRGTHVDVSMLVGGLRNSDCATKNAFNDGSYAASVAIAV